MKKKDANLHSMMSCRVVEGSFAMVWKKKKEKEENFQALFFSSFLFFFFLSFFFLSSFFFLLSSFFFLLFFLSLLSFSKMLSSRAFLPRLSVRSLLFPAAPASRLLNTLIRPAMSNNTDWHPLCPRLQLQLQVQIPAGLINCHGSVRFLSKKVTKKGKGRRKIF